MLATPQGNGSGKPVILVVDDDIAILRLVARILYGTSTVVTADSAAAAIERLETATYDIIISDHDMPEINGRELLAEVRKRWPDTARVLMSGNHNLDVAGMQRSGDIEHFVRKPFQTNEFRSEVLERARPGSSLPV